MTSKPIVCIDFFSLVKCFHCRTFLQQSIIRNFRNKNRRCFGIHLISNPQWIPSHLVVLAPWCMEGLQHLLAGTIKTNSRFIERLWMITTEIRIGQISHVRVIFISELWVVVMFSLELPVLNYCTKYVKFLYLYMAWYELNTWMNINI